jgi:glycosyltransferase involved in cell wall biosynthesis
MKPMRIAHITATFPPYEGGAGRVCFQNAVGLVARGHEVHVYTGRSPNGEIAAALPEGLHIHRLKPLLQIGNAPFLPGLLALKRVDVAHLHLPFIFGAELTWLASVLRGIPYVVTYHNDLIGDGARARLFDLYMRWAMPVVLRRARKIGAVTLDHALHSRAAAEFKRREGALVEIPNGVDSAHFTPDPAAGAAARMRLDIPADAPTALFVGALDRAHHYRRVDLLLEAVAGLGDLSAYLIVVGDGDLRATYEAQARALALTARTRFVGKVPHADLPAYYNAADVVVLPSQLQESFGMVLIEAMACGKPAIASALPGVRTIVRDGEDGLLVAPGADGALTAALRTLLTDPARRAEMGRAGRRKVEARFSWDSITTRLEALYADAIGKL